MGIFGKSMDLAVEIPRVNLGILPPPPAAAAMRWAKYAREAFENVRLSTGAVRVAAHEASKWAGVAKQAASMSMNQQAMKDIANAAAVAKTLGYGPEAVGVPTMQVLGELPPTSPPYSFNYPNPPPPVIESGLVGWGTVGGELVLGGVVVAQALCGECEKNRRECSGANGGSSVPTLLRNRRKACSGALERWSEFLVVV